MKILFLIHEFPPVGGGAGIALYHLATAIQQQGHDIAVLCCGSDSDPSHPEDFIVRRIPVSSSRSSLSGLRAWFSFIHRAPRELNTLSKQFQPDVINAHFAFPAGWIAARCTPACPLVTSVIGADIHDPTRRVSADRNPLIRRAVGTALQRSQAVIADSEDLASRTTRLYPAITPQVIHFGMPPLQPSQTPRTALGIPEGQVSVVTLSRLVQRKRLDYLINAVAKLPGAPLHLTLLGDGPLRKDLESQVTRLGLRDRVQFKGFVTEEEKAAYLTQADLFCLPSEHEGFGLVFLEAMSVGTPVLTTSRGGQTDIIQHQQNGLLIDQPNVDAIAAELSRLCADPSILLELSARARQRALEFTPAAAASGYLNVFETTLSST